MCFISMLEPKSGAALRCGFCLMRAEKLFKTTGDVEFSLALPLWDAFTRVHAKCSKQLARHLTQRLLNENILIILNIIPLIRLPLLLFMLSLLLQRCCCWCCCCFNRIFICSCIDGGKLCARWASVLYTRRYFHFLHSRLLLLSDRTQNVADEGTEGTCTVLQIFKLTHFQWNSIYFDEMRWVTAMLALSELLIYISSFAVSVCISVRLLCL